MELSVAEEGGVHVIEGQPGQPFMASAKDAGRIIEACLSEGVYATLLYAENLTPAFFDLSSGEAGEILQKLRNYRVRLAVVRAPGSAKLSQRFSELMIEENREPHFRIFETRDAARQWLAGETVF
jgi:hypothetical protein